MSYSKQKQPFTFYNRSVFIPKVHSLVTEEDIHYALSPIGKIDHLELQRNADSSKMGRAFVWFTQWNKTDENVDLQKVLHNGGGEKMWYTEAETNYEQACQDDLYCGPTERYLVIVQNTQPRDKVVTKKSAPAPVLRPRSPAGPPPPSLIAKTVPRESLNFKKAVNTGLSNANAKVIDDTEAIAEINQELDKEDAEADKHLGTFDCRFVRNLEEQNAELLQQNTELFAANVHLHQETQYLWQQIMVLKHQLHSNGIDM